MKALGVTLIVIGLCLAPTVAGAQSSVGVKGSLALSKWIAKDLNEGDWLTGGAAGVFASIPVARGVFFQPEALYVRKGMKFQNDFLGSTIWAKLDYVEVPLLMKLSPQSRRTVGFNVFGGVAPAFRARARYTHEQGNHKEVRDVKDDVKPFDMGVVGGVGVHVGRISGEVRWTEGLLNVAKDSHDKVHNRSLGVLLGFRF